MKLDLGINLEELKIKEMKGTCYRTLETKRTEEKGFCQDFKDCECFTKKEKKKLIKRNDLEM